MKVFVTGGAGFIGSHLVESLLSSGYEVSVLDDLSTGLLENINKFESHKNFKFTKGCILNKSDIKKAGDSCQMVFHLAAAVGVKNIIEKPLDSMIRNLKGTENILEFSQQSKAKCYIASTSEVYGKGTKIPFSEEDDLLLGPPHKHRWSYAAAKLADEHLALSYAIEKELNVIVGRHFNTVGPRQSSRYGMVIPRFIDQALQELPLTVYGNGLQSRCFTHVRDVIPLMIQVMEDQSIKGEIINFGSNQEISINCLAKTVIQETKSSSTLVYQSYESVYGENFEDMQRRVPDTSKLSRITHKVPMTSIQEIIKDIVANLKEG